MDALVPRGAPMTQEVAPERQAGQERVRANMRELVTLYQETGHSLLACSACVTIIPQGDAFALHYNPIRMIGQVHCLTCYSMDIEAQQARYTIVRAVS